MRYIVRETFATPLHRFQEGMEIDDSEIDGPMTARDWMELGKLADPEGEKPDALQEEAIALGIKIDRRWGATRLREEIEAVKAEQAKAAAAAEQSSVNPEH